MVITEYEGRIFLRVQNYINLQDTRIGLAGAFEQKVTVWELTKTE